MRSVAGPSEARRSGSRLWVFIELVNLAVLGSSVAILLLGLILLRQFRSAQAAKRRLQRRPAAQVGRIVLFGRTQPAPLLQEEKARDRERALTRMIMAEIVLSSLQSVSLIFSQSCWEYDMSFIQMERGVICLALDFFAYLAVTLQLSSNFTALVIVYKPLREEIKGLLRSRNAVTPM